MTSVLANHAYVKMNGIGNEIVVVDLREGAGVVTADEARAVASPKGVPYDQLMILLPPRLSGTSAFMTPGVGIQPSSAAFRKPKTKPTTSRIMMMILGPVFSRAIASVPPP